MDSKRMSQATMGIVVIVIGLIMLGHQLRLGLDFGRLWPIILIVMGLGKFFAVDVEGRRQNGAWLLFIGGLLLLNNLRILGLGDSWPLFIVAGGLGLMFGRDPRDRPAPGPASGPADGANSSDRFGNGGIRP